MNSIRARIKRLSLSVGCTLAFLVAAEVMLGLQYETRRQDAGFTLDNRLGWKPVPEFHCKKTTQLYGDVDYSTTEFGFRRYGDIHSEKAKILILGDSYTAADTVSDGKAYFDKLAEKLDTEVFAFGCNGYSTLQELLVLKSHHERISPDLVIWQLCDNDFVNNLHELESKDLLQNNFMPRPYRIGNTEVVTYPSLSFGWLLEHSQLARWAYRSWMGRRRKQFDYGKPENAQLANQAIELTSNLLVEAQNELGDVPILIFCNRHGGLYSKSLNAAGLQLTLAVEKQLDQAVAAGAKVDARPRDLHWNEVGHAIVAEALASEISDRKLLTGV